MEIGPSWFFDRQRAQIDKPLPKFLESGQVAKPLPNGLNLDCGLIYDSSAVHDVHKSPWRQFGAIRQRDQPDHDNRRLAKPRRQVARRRDVVRTAGHEQLIKRLLPRKRPVASEFLEVIAETQIGRASCRERVYSSV